MDPLVSIVIAAYNMGKYLPSAIESVLSQTFPHIEIHVVDDGSTDLTPEIIRDYLSDPRITYHRQENKGQASAKNKGILSARGDFVAFLDADDLWTPDKLSLQLPLFDQRKKIGVIYTKMALLREDGTLEPEPPKKYHSGKITGVLLIDNFVNGMTSVVRRECFDTCGTFDESLPMGIDYDLWLRMSTRYDFLFLDRVTYLYRIWPGQMSHNHKKRGECAEIIMRRFIDANRSLLDKSTIDEAWAHTYVGRGAACAEKERNKVDAFRDYLRALRYKTTYLPAWGAIIKLFISKRTAESFKGILRWVIRASGLRRPANE